MRQAMITSCTITNHSITSCYAQGIGVYCESSSPTFTNCEVYANTSSGERCIGGGIYISSPCSPTFAGCTIQSNHFTAFLPDVR